MTGENTEDVDKSEDGTGKEELTFRELVQLWAREQGVRFGCPNCHNRDLDEVTETGLASGEVHTIHGVECTECGFWAVTSTIGKATARGRSHVEWPEDRAPDAPEAEEPEEDGDGDE